ncbi:MAG: orotidine-5'-phosphate decarboxylase [Acidobacteria bacterium]|nr:orotidine-5'-phosphate decarboxylase [Acidobacteriota bacterium]NIM63342.1 orotidine-5'-phosphate decarboxylase [Acidobacteriota bacterium]NIO57994.1 orotidine-5'-phosphate decarboxylase [Acidobacteriota bacterium]NIQ28996.1 orotidine-5'-phosphate decarboxylase [Acidobacteriota bacterium]NIQ83516.1 orotidine-5'-phosphate decarboxylase [Acidobacteriota bacterium]
MSVAPDRRVFVALDTDDLGHAESLAQKLEGAVGGFKIGLQLFGRHGIDAVRTISAYGEIFLDLKLHDIPNTVAGAAGSIAALGVRWFTVHASGGVRMMRRAVEAAGDAARAAGKQAPGALAVTVLTSHDEDELAAIGLSGPCRQAVVRLAGLAREAQTAGLVCSALEIAAVREAFPGATLMVPGIRPASGTVGNDDQSRVATPADAVRAGADLLVVGRPITRADDPRAAARAVADELS